MFLPIINKVRERHPDSAKAEEGTICFPHLIKLFRASALTMAESITTTNKVLERHPDSAKAEEGTIKST